MLKFKKLELADMEVLRSYLQNKSGRLCDWTVGGTFIWRDFFRYSYAILDGTLFMATDIYGGRRAFTVPISLDGDYAESDEPYAELRAFCQENQFPLIFSEVDAHGLEFLQKRFPNLQVTPERDFFDYLYEVDDLIALNGKVHKATRNNIRRFMRRFPECVIEPLSEKHLSALEEFIHRYDVLVAEDNKVLSAESAKIKEVLHNMQYYGHLGMVIHDHEQIIAYTLGEIKADTLYVHVEKADTSYEGAYQMLMHSFVKYCRELDAGLKYVNREDDAGDEGLRRSKLSYNPCCLVEKYTVTVC